MWYILLGLGYFLPSVGTSPIAAPQYLRGRFQEICELDGVAELTCNAGGQALATDTEQDMCRRGDDWLASGLQNILEAIQKPVDDRELMLDEVCADGWSGRSVRTEVPPFWG